MKKKTKMKNKLVVGLLAGSLLLPVALEAREYTVRVNGSLRVMRVDREQDGTHFRFFDDKRYLGEEIVDRDGVKVYDAYLENTGEWTQDYYLRFQ